MEWTKCVNARRLEIHLAGGQVVTIPEPQKTAVDGNQTHYVDKNDDHYIFETSYMQSIIIRRPRWKSWRTSNVV
jgi:hypothetical protein